MTGPLIFISAVTAEHKTTRQRIAHILTRLGYQAVWQDIFGTEPGDLRQMLRDKIDACDGLIHVAGEAYGAEPPEVDAEFGRVSYTQFEFLYARKQGKTTWLIFPGLGCTRDTPAKQLDWPRDSTHPDPAGFQIQRRQLQEAYRNGLRQSGHLWHEPVDNTDLELKVERLRNEFADLREGFQRWQNRVLAGVALSLVLLGCVLAGLWWIKKAQQQGVQEIKAQKITAARIRVHLIEASEARLRDDLAHATLEQGWEKRDELKEAAQRSHTARLARVDELAEAFVRIESHDDATTVSKELTRILTENGVDAALAYLDRRRDDVLRSVKGRVAASQEQNRAELLPLLKGAVLQAAKGETSVARSHFKQILDIEPNWPEAMRDFAWFLYNESIESERHGTLNPAIADTTQALDLATRSEALGTADLEAQRLLPALLHQMGVLLVQRALPGDVALALTNFNRGNERSERLLKANPGSARAARDVSVSLTTLGDFLARRGLPGDATAALTNYYRGLEIGERLLKANPDSAEAAHDVSVSLNKLGDALTRRGLPGDAATALTNYYRSLEMRERLLKANRDSAQAARDVSINLNKLGVFLSKRGLPGDAAAALANYNRDVEISERLLKANPDSAQATRDLSTSLNTQGNYLTQRGLPGDAALALTNYYRSLEMRERLLKANPDSAQATREVCMSLNKVGEFLSRRGLPGDAELALTNYNRSLELLERLLKANPDSAEAARDVSVNLNQLGDFLFRRGLPDDVNLALANYNRDLEISERLLKANPDSAEAARDLSASLNKLGDLLSRRGRPGDAALALTNYSRSLETRERLLKANPDSAEAARDVVVTLYKMARTANSTEEKQLEGKYQRAMYDLLRSRVRAGVVFDPTIMSIYEQLHETYGQ